MKPASFAIIVSLAFVISLLQNAEQVHGFRTYLIVGDRGAGKSTLGNSILSKNSSISDIKNGPFSTKEPSTKITASGNNKTRVIDTFDFVNQKADQAQVLHQLRKTLAADNYTLDAVLYVINSKSMNNGTVEFLQLIQEQIFENYTRNNSILICSECEEGWLDEERKANADLNSIIENCGNLTYNFAINLEEKNETEEVFSERSHKIDGLKTFLNDQTFEKLDLSFIKNESYKVFFLRKVSDYKNHLIGTGIGVGVVGGLIAIAKVAGVLA